MGAPQKGQLSVVKGEFEPPEDIKDLAVGQPVVLRFHRCIHIRTAN